MQEEDSSYSRPLSIGKKKGGFLFANAPEKTPEDLRREEEEREQQVQEALEQQKYSAPAAPSNIPLATFGTEKEEEMATASSLRERLKQYQSLKAEQEMNSTRNNDAPTDQDSFMGPPINKPEETKQEEVNDDSPPEESWVPRADDTEEGITVDEEVEFPEEQYEEEELVEEEDDDDEVEEEVEEVTEGNDEYEEEEIVGESERKLETQPSVDMEEDQAVFQALDDAERAERSFPAPPPPAPTPIRPSFPPEQSQSPPPTQSYKPRETMPQRDEKSCKQNTIIILVIFVGLIAIAALVIPFVYDSGKNRDIPGDGGESPTEAPIMVPTDPPSPTVSPAPTTESSPTTAPGPTEPTFSPTTMRFNQFVEQFLIPISGEEVFEDKTSPQYQAAVHIADEDPFTSELTTLEQLEDRYAAITFYFATGGGDWTQCYLGDESCTEGQWLIDDVCGWYAVSCNELGRITGFLFAEASGNGLSGSLPMEIYLLASMEDLIIVNNTLTGSLPDVFGTNSTNMRSLLLPGNSLEGTIPSDYLANSPLEIVILGDNKFSGPVPTGLGGGSSLQILDLSGNGFTGGIPSDVSSYVALRELNLATNSLGGNIPDSIYDIQTLERLFLNSNPLTGTLSGDIGNLDTLQSLNLGDSNLEGFLPDELYSLTTLLELDIGGAGFSGQLSVGFINLSSSLRRLNVDNNSLQGTVPDSFGQMTTLEVLELHGNAFTGTISESICALVNDGSLKVLTADCEAVTCNCCTECF